MRVRFAHTARYKDLTFVLDLMIRENVRKYLLDIVHEPTTFYAFTDAHERHLSTYSSGATINHDEKMRHGHFEGCIFYGDIITSMPPSIPFWDPTWLQPLLQPEWQASVWLLAVIVTLGSWRVIGPRRAT